MQTNEAEILMPDIDSTGQLEMRALSSRLRDYAAEMHGEPEKAFDLSMAAELMTHLANLTTKLSRRPMWKVKTARTTKLTLGCQLAA
jgi:hypothetical protein